MVAIVLITNVQIAILHVIITCHVDGLLQVLVLVADNLGQLIYRFDCQIDLLK